MITDPVKSILLIEDEPGDALLIQEMLEQQGCAVRLLIAERLSAGLEQLRQNQFDVILLDMHLPDSTGLPTMTRLQDVAPDTPIIVLTGLADEAVGTDAVRSGAQDYLIKGNVNGPALKRAIDYAIERKRLEVSLKQARDLFERQARIDFLTGSYNRLMFQELLNAELQRSRRYATDLSLIMFDLDHFKHINDSFGHTVGDHVLKEIVTLTADNLRAHDVLARWGGEEFMVIVPQNNQRQALVLADKLRCLCELHDFGNGLHLTASFGVVQHRPDDTLHSIITRVDEAMYLAKTRGRNRVELL